MKGWLKAFGIWVASSIGFAGWLAAFVIAVCLIPVFLVILCMAFFAAQVISEGEGGMDRQMEGY